MKCNFCFLFLYFFVTYQIFAQKISTESDGLDCGSFENGTDYCDSTEILEWFETQEKAQYPGGDTALAEFIKARAYIPEYCDTTIHKITAFISFVIEVDGSVSTFKSMRAIPGKCPFEDMAISILKLMPTWQPAIRCDKPARMKYIVPVRFVRR